MHVATAVAKGGSGSVRGRLPAGEGALVDIPAAEERDECRGTRPVVLSGSPPPIILVHDIFTSLLPHSLPPTTCSSQTLHGG